jgi:hypothetical protein
MKTRTSKLIALAIVMLAFTASTFAQVTATATASAVVITPLAITKNVDMHFGRLAVNAVAGDIELSAEAAATRTESGGVTLIAGAPVHTAARFTVTGLDGLTFDVTLPAGSTSLDDNASHTMTVDSWTTDVTNPVTISGSTVFYVGGTLNVGANQAAGTYTSDIPFTITVNYN